MSRHPGFNVYKEWKRFGKRINALMEKRDFRGMAMHYYEVADYLESKGKDAEDVRDLGFRAMLRLRLRDLRIMRKFDPFLKLRILTADDSCVECKRLACGTLSIQEARSRELLPSRECTEKHGCRCVYIPVLEDRHQNDWLDAMRR